MLIENMMDSRAAALTTSRVRVDQPSFNRNTLVLYCHRFQDAERKPKINSIKFNVGLQGQMTPQKPKKDTTAPPLKDPKNEVDQVKEDGVMKELFRKEEESRQTWERNWGFMKNPKKLWVDEASKRGLPVKIFSGRYSNKLPVSSSWAEWKVQNINLLNSKKIPEKSSGMVGWRSSVQENDYNKLVGPLYLSSRLTMNPPLGQDEPDPRKQRFIFLG